MREVDLFERRLAVTPSGVSLFMLPSEVQLNLGYMASGNANGRTVRDEMSSLREDLKCLQAGWAPGEDELAGSPHLKDWGITFCEGEPLWRLVGQAVDVARDLPGTIDGETLCTMQVLAIDDEFTWARDRRGFYLLGRPRAGS